MYSLRRVRLLAAKVFVQGQTKGCRYGHHNEPEVADRRRFAIASADILFILRFAQKIERSFSRDANPSAGHAIGRHAMPGAHRKYFLTRGHNPR
jgi:hypothetical protein